MKVEKSSLLSSLRRKKTEKQHLYDLNYDLNYFINLDNENKICFDCGGPFPTYVSINNGVFICEKCAKNHKKLGNNISYIHQICSPWDPYLLSYAVRGGNSRFKHLCMLYDITCETFYENNEEKLNKYIIKLGEYNRLNLKSEILAEEPPKPLDYKEAKKKCNLNIIYFPEFENYQLYKGEFLPDKNNSISGKIRRRTKSAADIVGSAGVLIYKAGKPVISLIGRSAYKGVNFLGNSFLDQYKKTYKKNKNNNDIYHNNNYNNNHNYNYNNNLDKNKTINDYTVIDYYDDDSSQINNFDLNNPKEGFNMDINNNINIINNNDINSNKYNIFNINNKSNNNSSLKNINLINENSYDGFEIYN